MKLHLKIILHSLKSIFLPKQTKARATDLAARHLVKEVSLSRLRWMASIEPKDSHKTLSVKALCNAMLNSHGIQEFQTVEVTQDAAKIALQIRTRARAIN